METIEDTTVNTTTEPSAPSRWPIVLIVLLAIAVVGLIAWMTLAMRPNSPTAAPPEVVELVEGYNAAFNAYDMDALEELVTPSYRLHSSMIDYDIDGLRAEMIPKFEQWDWKVTNDGPYYAISSNADVENSVVMYVTFEGAVVTRSGVDYGQQAVLMVVQVNGEYLVAEHYFMGG